MQRFLPFLFSNANKSLCTYKAQREEGADENPVLVAKRKERARGIWKGRKSMSEYMGFVKVEMLSCVRYKEKGKWDLERKQVDE